ncbi:acetate kinase [Cryphonectria parasitica EP155]|uniref:Probable acetate kinase n=1 Tax=Cryphonectria parasitica (strain ATCC 38755 / EP155) TaxID=660469 RepID=A0A9P4Y0J4_CRYP1|nr:acetate kinase [Cryphonectria parasitica EP155]KAF3764769.1 acetate kinase [Cryphonectria parasitica EP155]
MKKIILSVNAGSSSVKISVYEAEAHGNPTQLAEAQISGLTSPPPKLTYVRGGQTASKDEELGGGGGGKKVGNQDDAFRIILSTLTEDPALPQLASKDDVAIVCHRIVHGGDFRTAQVINEATYHRLEELNDLAPLHNAPSLEIVKSCIAQLPGAINVACFDSQFHASMPVHVRTYPIDQGIARKNGLRKYGFHGISYSFITRSAAEFLGKDVRDVNLIALHLGSGASACAIKGGKSWDTSMGLTPLAGLPGATRSGSIDPSLVFHYASDVGKLSPSSTKELHISVAETILNKESGWKALTGTTNFGTIASSSDPKHQLAFDLFVDRVCGFVGSYYVTLRGQVDALVFAGGIGEKSDKLRRAVVDRCACLGFEVDLEKNASRDPGETGKVVRDVGLAVHKDGRTHRVLVVQTDEQFEMAHAAAQDPALWADELDEVPDLELLRVKSGH